MDLLMSVIKLKVNILANKLKVTVLKFRPGDSSGLFWVVPFDLINTYLKFCISNSVIGDSGGLFWIVRFDFNKYLLKILCIEFYCSSTYLK